MGILLASEKNMMRHKNCKNQRRLKALQRLFENKNEKVFFSLLDSLFTFSQKIISIKNISTSNLSFSNPWSANFGLKSLMQRRLFCCTGFLSRRKLVHLDAKSKMSLFATNFVQNSMRLLIASEKNRKLLENFENRRWL